MTEPDPTPLFAEGELDVPAVRSWPIYPFVGDVRVREVLQFSEHERVRNGDPDGDPCWRCGPQGRAQQPVWSNDRWAVHRLQFGNHEAPFPAYMLETVDHLDIGDLDAVMGAELGVLTLRLERAIMAIGTVGRVHVNRWGDGASHFHVWFLGRPFGAWQLSGYMLPLWGFTLPSLDDATLAANDRAVAENLTAAATAD